MPQGASFFFPNRLYLVVERYDMLDTLPDILHEVINVRRTDQNSLFS